MCGCILVRYLAYQHHAQADHKLGNRAGVGVRSVKNRNAVVRRRRKVDLIDADTKRPDREQFISRLDHRPRYLRLRPDADQVNTLDRLDQLLFAQSPAEPGDLVIVARLELGDGRVGDILEQEDLDLVTRIRCSGGVHKN